jgi:hypothetical protein
LPAANIHLQFEQAVELPPTEGPEPDQLRDSIAASSQSVPEPYAYLLAATGVMGLLSMGRVMRRRKNVSRRTIKYGPHRKSRSEIPRDPTHPARRRRTSDHSLLR